MKNFLPKNGVVFLFFLNIILLFIYIVGLPNSGGIPMKAADIILTQMSKGDFSSVNVTNLMYYVIIFGQIAVSMVILMPIDPESRHRYIKPCMGVVSAAYLLLNWWTIDWVISFLSGAETFSPDFTVFRNKSYIIGDNYLWGLSGLEIIPLNIGASLLWYQMAHYVNRDRHKMIQLYECYMILQFAIPHLFLLLIQHRLMNRALITQSLSMLAAQVIMLVGFILAATKREVWKETISVFLHRSGKENQSDYSHHGHSRHHSNKEYSNYQDITGCEEPGEVFGGSLLRQDKVFNDESLVLPEDETEEPKPEYYI